MLNASLPGETTCTPSRAWRIRMNKTARSTRTNHHSRMITTVSSHHQGGTYLQVLNPTNERTVFWSPPSKLCQRCLVVSGYVGYFRASKVFLSKPHDTKNPEQARSSAYATITHLLLRTQRVYFIPVCAFSTAPFFYSPLPAAVQDVLVWIYLFLWQYSSKVTLYRRPLLLLIL